MLWERCNLVFEPQQQYPWLQTHAALPVVDHIADDRYRVYFSGRDDKGRAQIGYFELAMLPSRTVLTVSPEPVIGLGLLGSFDDNGVTSSCIVTHGSRKYQYYTGWTLGVTVPFYFYVGLAISEDGGLSFHKVSPAPILERNALDPYLTASPSVLIEGDLWRMWYISCTGWAIEHGILKHYYHIKYAESADGIAWKRTGHICIDYASSDEYALARPVVIKEGSGYKMWFSYRGTAYRIGYAESVDGLVWERNDQLGGLTPSGIGWESEMVEYGCVFDHNSKRYMLYNGNQYGATGIGLAVMR
jgi:hypothetical protein